METLRPQYARLNEGIVFLHVTKDGTIECESYEDILTLMQNYSLIEIWRKKESFFCMLLKTGK